MAARIQLTDTPASKGIEARYLQHLGKELYLFDSTFQGKTYVHVRKLLHQKFPTKDGIALTLNRCGELYSCLQFADIAVTEMERGQGTFYRRHLGGNWHLTVQSGFNCVDIRKFWLPEGATEICPTKRGVSLTFPQYRELRNGLRGLDSYLPELSDVYPCYSDPNHDIPECKECTPA